jgi:hypothetical protein
MTHWRPFGTGIWVGEYEFGGNPLNTLVVDMGEGKLAVFSPGTDVDDAAYAELDGLGKVAALVSPGAFHNMGLPWWHERYPEAKLFGTESGLAHIAKVQPDLPPLAPMSGLQALAGDAMTLYETPGKQTDLLLFVQRGDDVTLFSNEYLVNWVELPGNFVFGLMFKWTNSAPGVRLAKPSAWFLRAKLADVARFCLDKIEVHGVTRFVPCHGAPLEGPDTRARLEEAIRARL